MILEVEVKTAGPQPMATVSGSSTMRELPRNIRKLFDQFYAKPPDPPRGLNIVYYHGQSERDLFANGGEMPIECGTLMPSMDSANRSTPAGRVVTVAYFGAYQGLAEAYDALLAYCRAHKLERAGPFWEVYGHWNDDPAKLRTDVFMLLQ